MSAVTYSTLITADKINKEIDGKHGHKAFLFQESPKDKSFYPTASKTATVRDVDNETLAEAMNPNQGDEV
jgi:hypothetical protein